MSYTIHNNEIYISNGKHIIKYADGKEEHVCDAYMATNINVID